MDGWMAKSLLDLLLDNEAEAGNLVAFVQVAVNSD